jgi:hypothetical protein
MTTNRNLLVSIITASLVVIAISSVFGYLKAVEAQPNSMFSWVYVETTTDSTGHFQVPLTDISTASCKPTVLGAILSAQADNMGWYSVPVINGDPEKLARRGDQFFAWRDPYVDPMYDGTAIGGQVSGFDSEGPIRIIIFLKAGVC